DRPDASRALGHADAMVRLNHCRHGFSYADFIASPSRYWRDPIEGDDRAALHSPRIGARLSRRRASVRVGATVACRDQVRLYRVPRAALSLLVVRLFRRRIQLRAVPLIQAVVPRMVVPRVVVPPAGGLQAGGLQAVCPLVAGFRADVPPAVAPISRTDSLVAPASTAAVVRSAVPVLFAASESQAAATAVLFGTAIATALAEVAPPAGAAVVVFALVVPSRLPMVAGRERRRKAASLRPLG